MSRNSPNSTRSAYRLRRGFTLIEAALVTTIISVGVIAMLQLLAAGTVSNQQGTELTTAMNLAKNIREMSLGMSFCDPTTPTNWGAESGESLYSYDDVDDLDGRSFSPPIDVQRQTITEMANWTQAIRVETVDPDFLASPVPNGSAPANRVTVTVSHNNRTVCTISWLCFDAGS